MIYLPQGYYYDDKGHLVCLPYSTVRLHIMASDLMIKAHWFHKNHYDIPKRRWDEITGNEKCAKVRSRVILGIIRGTVVVGVYNDIRECPNCYYRIAEIEYQ